MLVMAKQQSVKARGSATPTYISPHEIETVRWVEMPLRMRISATALCQCRVVRCRANMATTSPTSVWNEADRPEPIPLA